jgi:hypothetical protein
MRFRPGRRFIAGTALMGAVALALLAPALAKYAEQGERRGYEDYRGMKARDLVTPSVGSYLWKGHFTFEGVPALQEHALYPGVTVVALAAAGAVATARRRPGRSELEPPRSPDARLHLVLLAVAGTLGLVLAIGPTALGIPMPYRFFHAYVPGFSGIRVYTRLAVLFLLAIALTAGAGISALLLRLETRPPLTRVVVGLGALALVLVDLSAPIGYAPFPDDERTLAVYHALEDRPPGAVVEVPMVDSAVLPADWAYVEAPRMVYSTLGFRPRVNGYSAKAPESYPADLVTFNGFPSEASLARARELRVRYVIVHVGPVTDHAQFSEADADAKVTQVRATGATAERHGSSWLVDLGTVRGPDGATG